MSEPQGKEGGLFASLRRILDGGLALVQNRVELLAVEVRQEKCRLAEAIMLASAVVALAMMTLTLLTFLIVTLCCDNGRVAVLLVLSLVYMLAALKAWSALRARLKGAAAFAGTLDEIKKDRACLGTRN